jgi:hypothetical protein
MNLQSKTAIAVVLAAGLLTAGSMAQDTTQTAKKHTVAKKAKTPPPPTVQEQIKALREELEGQEGQINGLKSDLAARDAQLKQIAADAQAAAEKAQAAASAQQQAVTENAAAVTTLQATVTDLKGNQASLASTVSDETGKMKKALESPGPLHYKGITLTPYGFVNGESVYRTHATGGELATPFSAIPYEGADSYLLSETYLSGRQSRPGLIVEGKTGWGTLRAIIEGDFLGSGTTSNGNQSNSYVFRQRIALAEVETSSGWTFSGGQGWTLAVENLKGISTAPTNIALPSQIDPNYVTGLVWAREDGFRVTRSFKNGAFGISAENPQVLYTTSLAGNTPYAVLGSAGVNGGLLNAAISACSPSTSIVNYTNQTVTDSNGDKVNIAVPVYKTVNSCANLANISFNQAPDMLVKAAFDPGFGHYEIFGIARFAHETIYPGETTNGNLYGGLTDIVSGATVAPALSSAGAISNSIVLGGAGGSLRLPVIKDKLTVGAKGLFGPGVGRYGNSTLSDVTANSSGALEPIHNLSGLLTAEAHPAPRLLVYVYYGGDYAGREDFANSGATTLGAPKAAQNATSGLWGGTWKAPAAAAVGYGSRLLNNSACTETANPGYNGSSTGYYPGGSCGAQTRDTQELTGGYWYDIYKGDRGRLRQGLQYGYAVREGWSGAPLSTGTPGIGAKGVENMFWTSFRYYLP